MKSPRIGSALLRTTLIEFRRDATDMAFRTPGNRTITADSFARLLARLDADAERAAREYERLHRALVRFLDWRGALRRKVCGRSAGSGGAAVGARRRGRIHTELRIRNRPPHPARTSACADDVVSTKWLTGRPCPAARRTTMLVYARASARAWRRWRMRIGRSPCGITTESGV